MLQLIRSKAGSFVVKVLFVLLIGSFGIWGIGDFLRQRPQDATVIAVGDRKVQGDQLQADVQRELERARQLFGGSLDLEQARQLGLIDRVVDQIVARALLDQEAQRLNLMVGDKEIAQAIAQQPAFRGPNGQFDHATFVNVLAANRLTEGQYVAMLRGDIARNLLAALAGGTAAAPETLTDLIYRIRNEQRVADWVFLPASAVKDIPKPDQAAERAYYDQHHDAFTAPEYRGFTALAMLPETVASEVQIPEDKLKDAYSQRIDEFTKPEKRHLIQVLLPDEAAAQAAEAALAQGKDIAEVAKTIAKQEGGPVDLGWVAKPELPPEIAGPAFDAKDGAVTAPIKTPFGWHVVKVAGIEQGGTESFEEAKPKLEAELRKDAEADALYKLSNKVEDAISAGADLDSIAQQFNLKPFKVAAVDLNGKDPDGKPVAGFPVPPENLLKTVFDTAEGQMSGLAELQDGEGFYVVKVDSVRPPALKPFEQVEPQVKEAWLAAQRTERVAAAAKDLADRVKPDQPLAKLAPVQKLKLETTKPFTRGNLKGEAPLPPDLVAKLFKLEVGQAATAANAEGQYVAELTEVKPADPAADPSAVASVAQQLQGQIGGEMLQEFDGALKERYPVTIRQAAIDQMFGTTGQ